MNRRRPANAEGHCGSRRTISKLANPKQRTKIQPIVMIRAIANHGDANVVLRPGTVDQRCPMDPKYVHIPPAADTIGMNHSTIVATAARSAAQRYLPRTPRKEMTNNGPS